MAFNYSKVQEAKRIIQGCIGERGVWASPHRYRNQCWTRDFVLAVEDLILNNVPSDLDVIKNHLSQLAQRQRSNGQVPIMYLDDEASWVALKVWESLRKRRMSFLLKAFLSKDGVGSLSPWTRDSEVLFILGILKYVQKTGDQKFLYEHKQHIAKALSYIETTLMRNGLIYGGDWRDTRLDLGDKFLMTNNCLLYQAYLMLGETQKAQQLKKAINDSFWTGSYYRDYIGTDEWDTLGNAFAILFGMAPAEYAEAVFNKAEELDTPFGYKLNTVTLPALNNKEAEMMKRTNQFGVIWPFIHGFMILAAIKAGMNDLAKRQFAKWDKVPGFYEWYDSVTGEGCGSNEQLWSAALYLRAYDAVRKIA